VRCRVAATGCSDSAVRLWDTRSSSKIGKLKGHHDIVRCVRIMGGGSSMALVSAASDGVLCLWDVRMQSHALTKTLPCHDDSIWALALLPDSSASSSCVLTGSRNGSITLSDLATGESCPVGRCAFPIRKLLPVEQSCRDGQRECTIFVAGDSTSVHSLRLPSASSASPADPAPSCGDHSAAGGGAGSAVCGEGGEGLGAFDLMSDRMRAICETTSGDIVMCSVVTGGVLQRWSKVRTPSHPSQPSVAP
jgi:WD40 repeat protein